MKHKIVIVGAGLAGCILADQLADCCEVTIVELADKYNTLGSKVEDIGWLAKTVPIVSNGLGGTTAFWHNGLIEIDDSIFIKKWPYVKAKLSDAYMRAYQKLSDVSRDDILNAIDALKVNLIACGIPKKLMRQGLYYPNKRINPWKKFNLKHRVHLIYGDIKNIEHLNGLVSHLVVDGVNGFQRIEGDIFVLSAGGLGTPLILQKINTSLTKEVAGNVGLNYEDHPTAFIGRVILKNRISKFMNFSTEPIKGFLRMPLIIEHAGYLFSFQLRSSAQFRSKTNLISLLNSIRNQPFNLLNYLKLIGHVDDILDIASLKFGINLPTNKYTVLVVAEQPECKNLSVYFDPIRKKIIRNWQLDDSYIANVEAAFSKLVVELGSNVVESELFTNWSKNISSSAHHSGTARIHKLRESGVCNADAKVNGFDNFYICDGSAIPASGFSNTGLTIAALAIKLADHIKGIFLKV